MNSNTFGKLFSITTFGESHGEAVGVVIDGCPAGITIKIEDIQKELDKRRPGSSALSSPRDEKDIAMIYSGVFEGKTTGTPIMIMVKNESQKSGDYDAIKDLFRPGHADYTYYKKYGIRDHRGGGRSSVRESIGRVAALGIARKILDSYGIDIFAHVTQVGNITAETFDRDFIDENPLHTACVEKYDEMSAEILRVKALGDSIGAILEFRAKGVYAGVGEPIFDRLNARLSYALMSIPAVKGVEFGLGFNAVNYLGSQMNDEIKSDGFTTNNSGGMLGGISNGDDIYGRLVVKPVSSILIPKKTIDIEGNDSEIVTMGRHDSCVAARAVVIVEAMIALTLVDLILIDKSKKL